MQSLNHLVAMGKVLYLGASNTSAWVVRFDEYLLPACSCGILT